MLGEVSVGQFEAATSKRTDCMTDWVLEGEQSYRGKMCVQIADLVDSKR